MNSEYGHVCVSNSKKDFKAQVIKWVTRSAFSHSFLIAPPILGDRMAMEAAGNGVSLCHFDRNYLNDVTEGYRIYRFKADSIAKDQAIRKIGDTLETSYGYLELPWFAWRALNFALGRDIKAQNNWTGIGTICSELVRQYITLSGFGSLFTGFGDGSVNAQDVFQVCEANPAIFELIEVKE